MTRRRVHMDCSTDYCMLGDPTPCILFTQEIDPYDLVPVKQNSHIPTAAQVKHVYEHFVRSLNMINQNVPEEERIMLPFILQGILSQYIEERETVENIVATAMHT